MLRIFAVLCCAAVAGQAAAFNDDYHAGGQVVRDATSQAETATGLRQMAGAAQRSGHADGTFVAHVLELQALPRGLGDAADGMVAVARDGTLTREGYRDALAPLLAEIANTFRAGGADVEDMQAMAKSLADLDRAATDAGLPSVGQIIDETFGDGKAAAGLQRLFSSLLNYGESGDTSGASFEELRRLRQGRADALSALMSPRLSPYALQAIAARDVIVWTGGSFDRSSAIMDLVGDAIRTGRFDEASYAVLRDGLYQHISRGPWDTEAMKDALLGWCIEIAELGEYCEDVFREMKYALNSEVCGAIDCDCGSVRGVVPRIYQQECRKHQLDARMQCALRQQVVTGCRHPFGPAASPVQ